MWVVWACVYGDSSGNDMLVALSFLILYFTSSILDSVCRQWEKASCWSQGLANALAQTNSFMPRSSKVGRGCSKNKNLTQTLTSTTSLSLSLSLSLSIPLSLSLFSLLFPQYLCLSLLLSLFAVCMCMQICIYMFLFFLILSMLVSINICLSLSGCPLINSALYI